MKIVITGANSFIGKRLVKRLLALDYQLVLVLRPEHSIPNHDENIRIIPLDMEKYGQLGELVGACDCFVHLAWDGTRGDTRMDAIRQHRNVEFSTQAVCSMLLAGCRRIITAGSQAEYGPHSDQISEETVCRPNTEYGKAKLEFYHNVVALCEQGGISYKEPRFFSLYGPGDFPGAMIISILQDMLAGNICRLTQGVQLWDYLYIEDAVDGLVKLCTMPCSDGIYNFGSGDVRPLREYIEEMARITRSKSKLLFGDIPYPETGMVSLWPDITKLRQELDWQPTITFAEGVHRIMTEGVAE